MSQNQISPVTEIGFIDTARSHTASASTGLNGTVPAMLSIADMDRILLAAPFNLTQERIDSLTIWDKQYAIRTAFEAGTVDALDLLPVAITDAADPTNEVHPYGTVWIATTSGDTFQTAGDGNWKLLT